MLLISVFSSLRKIPGAHSSLSFLTSVLRHQRSIVTKRAFQVQFRLGKERAARQVERSPKGMRQERCHSRLSDATLGEPEVRGFGRRQAAGGALWKRFQAILWNTLAYVPSCGMPSTRHRSYANFPGSGKTSGRVVTRLSASMVRVFSSGFT